MPEYGQQVVPAEILLLTGAKLVKRLHGRETAEDLLYVAEVSQSRLRLALLFAVTLLVFVIRDASVFGIVSTSSKVASGSSNLGGSVVGHSPLTLLSTEGGFPGGSVFAAPSDTRNPPCSIRRVTPSNPQALSTPELRSHQEEVHSTCFRPPSDWSLSRVLPPLQEGVSAFIIRYAGVVYQGVSPALV